MSTIKGFYTMEEAARKIGVSHSQISRYISGGRLKAISLGKQLLIERQRVDNFKRPPMGNPAFLRRK